MNAEASMPADAPDVAVAFSRYLGLPAAAAMGAAVSFAVLLFVLGGEIIPISGDQAPLAFILATLLFLPLLLCLAERAGEVPGSASLYQLARSGGSTRPAFAAGWLMLGGLATLAAALVQALAQRLLAVLERLFGLEVGATWLVLAVVALAGLQATLTQAHHWRARTAVVWGSALVLAGLVTWAFNHQPPSVGTLPARAPLDHWLSSVALMAAALWGLEPILHHRAEMRRGARAVLPAMLIAWWPALLLAAASALLALRFPDLLAANWLARLSWSESRLELLSLLIAVTLCTAGLYWVLVSSTRLARDLTRDGFLPAWLTSDPGATGPETGPGRDLAVYLLAVFVLAVFSTPLPLAGAASLCLLWTAVVVLAPQIRRRREAPNRNLRLPLHPLLPVVAVAGTLFFSLVLPPSTLRAGVVWALLGLLYYLAYARRGGLAVQRREYVVGETAMRGLRQQPAAGEGTEPPFRVLTWAGDDDALPSLIRLGGAQAAARGGELLVLRILPLVEQTPMSDLREAAEEEWLALDRRVRRAESAGASIRTLVRVAPTPAGGILETAAEFRADWIVLAQQDADSAAEDPVADVFAATSRSMAVLAGRLPETGGRIVAATSGGPHAPAALELADALAGAAGSDPTLLAVATRQNPGSAAAEAAARTAEKAETRAPVTPTVVEAPNAAAALAEAAGEDGVLLLGASVDRLLGQTVLGGLAAEIAAASRRPTILVKRREKARRYWLRRAWQAVYERLPTLEVRERAEVFAQMRHQARAGVDYYVQIFLASAIAVLGLRLDSGAVIIGAMLVAPLMSPILGMAHGIVQGNQHLIRRGGASTAKGIGVAIGVSLATALLLPTRSPTHEMLARGHPSLLDLLVALAAGAAAAYAVSRKSVAAALPGVAISVALVPPLCVVGHALGSDDFPLAGGALLLFLTNLAGIILIGATVFLLLGFRPSRVTRGRRVGRGMLFATAAILVLAIPLGFETRRAARVGHLEARIAEGLERSDASRFRVLDYSIEPEGSGFLVDATIYAYEELSQEWIEDTRRKLEEVSGVPVEIRATVVEARVMEATAADPASE